VLVPGALWFTWWLVEGLGARSDWRPAVRPSASEAFDYAREVAMTPFTHLGLGNSAIAVALALLFFARGLVWLRNGLAAGSNFLAWTCALCVWSIGLAYGRGSRGITETLQPFHGVFFRYQLLSLGFALLAMVPRHPLQWPNRFSLTSGPLRMTTAAVVVLAVGGIQGIAVREAVEGRARWMEASGRTTEATLALLQLEPNAMPDEVVVGGHPGLRASEVRSLVRRYGSPYETGSAQADRVLLDLGVVSARSVPLRDFSCSRVTGVISWLPGPRPYLYLWSEGSTTTVEVRRFDSDWIPVARLAPGTAASLDLPTLQARTPWKVQAVGACRRSP